MLCSPPGQLISGESCCVVGGEGDQVVEDAGPLDRPVHSTPVARISLPGWSLVGSSVSSGRRACPARCRRTPPPSGCPCHRPTCHGGRTARRTPGAVTVTTAPGLPLHLLPEAEGPVEGGAVVVDELGVGRLLPDGTDQGGDLLQVGHRGLDPQQVGAVLQGGHAVQHNPRLGGALPGQGSRNWLLLYSTVQYSLPTTVHPSKPAAHLNLYSPLGSLTGLTILPCCWINMEPSVRAVPSSTWKGM